MRVRMTVTLTVDPERWASEFYLEPGEVREDVRSYLRSQITEDPVIIETCDQIIIR